MYGSKYRSGPSVGDRTQEGSYLTQSPSLDSPDYVKFAAFSDKRFFDPASYLKLQPFLPSEVKIVGPPAEQNCHAYTLGIYGFPNRHAFKEMLNELGYAEVKQNSLVRINDVIVYSATLEDRFSHSGRYVGEGRVRSRWGERSPVLEHPIEVVLPIYMAPKDGDYIVFRKD